MISEGTLAVEMGALASDLKLTIHPHPTLSETVMEATDVFFGKRTRAQTHRPRARGSNSGFDVTDDVKVWTGTSPIHKPTVCLVWLRPCRSLVTASMENSGDQETFIVSIDDVTAVAGLACSAT
jgi:hypothetical protein